MHIYKKVVIGAIGLLFPLLLGIAFHFDSWLQQHLAVSHQQDKLSQQVFVEASFRQAKASFDDVAGVYAQSYQAQHSIQQTVAPLGKAFADIRVYRYSPLQPDKFFALNSLDFVPSLGVIKQAVEYSQHHLSGYLWRHGDAFQVALLPVKDGEYLVFLQKLSVQYVNQLLAGTQLEQQWQISNSDQIPGIDNHETVSFALPTFADTPEIFVHSTFTPKLSPQVAKLLGSLSYAMAVLLSVGLVCVGVWIRRVMVRPIAELTQQINQLNPEQRILSSVQLPRAAEFSKLTASLNQLLDNVSMQRNRNKVTLEAINDAVVVTNTEHAVCYLNPSAEGLFQVDNRRAFGRDLDALVGSDSHFTPVMMELLSSDGEQTLVSKVKLKLNPPKIIERHVSQLTDYSGDVLGCVTVVRDITQEELLKSQLRRRANYDSITSLLNRSAFESQLPGYAANANKLAVCYMDLEQFKLINDNCGHSAGDEMLTLVAKAMQKCVAGRGLLARLGGDEFGLVVCDYSEREVELLLKMLIHSVSSQVIHSNDSQYNVGLSVGVAFGRRVDEHSVAELLKDADIACLAAKRKGNNQIHFYDDKDKELNYQRNAPKWAVRIAQAIEHNELLLYYQPIQGLSGRGQRKRLEILLRILEPNGKVLPPAQFIAAAERFKLMTEVDKDVIRKAFLWLSLHEEVWDDHCISINLSGNSFGAEGMIDYIKEQQARFEIPSECICFEITETSAIQNHDSAMDMLKQLRALGFAFALDDFGTGFASYGYLRELPVDYVKIDGCFIRNLANNSKDFAIVKSIHDVCIAMGIETVAEFVENQEIIDALQHIGINYAQGYAIGRPVALEQYLPIRTPKIA